MAGTVVDDEQLNEMFSALANPTRRAIIARLAEGEASVGELAEPFDMTLPAISRHIRVLERAGLIGQARRAQYRPCVLNGDALAEVSAWAEQCRHIWNERFDQMDDYLGRLVVADQADTAPSSTKSAVKKSIPNTSSAKSAKKKTTEK